jgi:hypothetical protein
LRLLLKMLNKGSSYIISSFALLKLIISYLSLIKGSAIKAIQKGTIIKGISLIIYLKGIKSLQIKKANRVVK